MAHGKKYASAQSKIEQGKTYSLSEAVSLAKETAPAKFGGSIDLHIRLAGKKPEDKQVRSMVRLPHGTGRKEKVEILDEQKIDHLVHSGKAEADIYLATPALMPQVAKIAKILGPQGKMPNPKSGTVTEKPQDKVKELAAGNVVEIRSDSSGNLHSSIGKVDWEASKLTANAEAILKIVPRTKIERITVAATMGPGVRAASS